MSNFSQIAQSGMVYTYMHEACTLKSFYDSVDHILSNTYYKLRCFLINVMQISPPQATAYHLPLYLPLPPHLFLLRFSVLCLKPSALKPHYYRYL